MMISAAILVRILLSINMIILTMTIFADQWSLGVVAFILLSGASPFLSEDEDDQKTLNNVALCVCGEN